jgi:hypothetical protein
MVNTLSTRASAFYRKHKVTVQVMLFVLVMVVANAVAFGQTDTPVEIQIPTDDMMTHLNTWISTFAPIVLLFGMIPVALGLLRYITKLFQQAFSGGGR